MHWQILEALNVKEDVNAPAGILRGVMGRTRGGRKLTSYMGIPYAVPPTGDLRFALSPTWVERSEVGLH